MPSAEPSSVEFRLYTDGVLRHALAVSNNEPFSLPGGYECVETEFSGGGVAAVNEIVVATSVAELADS